MLPEAVALLLKEWPEIDVSVVTGPDDRLLEDGQHDFVIADGPLIGEDVCSTDRELIRDGLAVCARRQHALSDGRRPTLDVALAARGALPPEKMLARRKLSGPVVILVGAEPARMLISNSITFLMNYASRTDALVSNTR